MWTAVSSFFEEQSALANFLQIAGALIGMLVFVWKAIPWVKKYLASRQATTISNWLSGRPCKPSEAKSLRIAIVDDCPEDYPLDSLRQLGYSVAEFHRLTLAEIPSLLKYDCVLLDINGVLDEDPKRGGLEILKRLKGGPYVVAVSSKGFDITMSDFFMLADQRLKKPIPSADVEGIIQQAYLEKFSADEAASRIDKAVPLSPDPSTSTKKALRAMQNYLASGQGRDKAQQCAMLFVPPGPKLESLLQDLDIIRRGITSP